MRKTDLENYRLLPDHNYKIKYDLKVESGEFTPVQLVTENKGGADCLALFNINHLPDGAINLNWSSHDGRTDEPMSIEEFFKFWLFMGQALARQEGLNENQKRLAIYPLYLIQEANKKKETDGA